MSYTFHPDPSFSYVTRKGDTGESVAALQVNLYGVVVDGRFGSQTKTAVSGFQEKKGLTVDGICGLATQQAICTSGSRGAETVHRLPKGMLKSLMANESGFALAAYSPHPSDPQGFDLGPYQQSFPAGSGDQLKFKRAYAVSIMAEDSALKIAAQHEVFRDPVDSWYLTNIAEGNEARFSWQLALFSHNWPSGADGICKRGSLFVDASRDTADTQWVIDASGGRLRTPREWAVAYIQKATVFVNWA